MTRIENGETKQEGLCLVCAKGLGIKPVDDMLEKMGISEEQMRAIANRKTRTLQNKAAYNNEAEKEEQLNTANEMRANAKPGSLAAKANMVRDYNERNSRK
jgi:hypothetical protein